MGKKHHHHHKGISRRKFLGQASCAALGTTTFFSTLFNLGMTNEAASRNMQAYAPQGNYKALVCILLEGGNDSFNMLVPRTGSTYNDYKTTRSNLAIKQSDLLNLNPITSGNHPELGVHPSMPEMQQLFNNGRLAFISNVGTLVEPTTKTQYENGGVTLPLGLFSHSDQIQQWQTSVPQSRAAYGWGGKVADILHSMNTNQNISMNISLSGRNIFQSGNLTSEYTIRPEGDGSIGINRYGGNNDDDLLTKIRTSAIDSLMEQQYNDIFTQTYADVVRDAQNTHELFSAGVGGVQLNTVFSISELSQSLNMVARTIGARDTLDVSRQTFFITYGGWDHHDEVLNAQSNMLAQVSKALKEFDDAMLELGVGDDVTTFAISDFGRTLTSNGNGTDHAWGGNVFAMGGSVKGGKIYGTYPDVALNTSLEIGGGVLIPTLSTDEYFAELAKWFGVSNSDLTTIFPNLIKFYSPNATPPIGFMNI